MIGSTAVFDATEGTFERDVLERSSEVPVVVDFWAAWCGPCRQLSPVLERLAEEGAGGWVLAKVDVDANPRLSATYRVQGIPAVHAFRDGKEVARFVGALPEQQVRTWLEQLGPSEADRLVEDARAAEAGGENETAASLYRKALSLEPANADARAGLARAELALRVTEAVPGDDPYARADAAFAAGDIDAGAAILIEIVARGGEDRERARTRLIELLETVPPDDDRAIRARRALANALF